ncbi:MAG: SGNH/GDSL hydrolase family protein [Lachnospiraceae bacterium]|nr:SGNH/GDSL hydrolase family protein [Lachnospiraceae bacterium]
MKRLVSILGDSISTYEGFNPSGYAVFYDSENQKLLGLQSVYDTWWAKVNQYLQAYLCVDNAYSGSKVSGANYPSASSIERTTMLHVDKYQPDIILIYIGFNDFGNGVPINYKIGCHNKADYFYYSYEKMLSRIKKNYPKAKIICGTLMKGFVKGRPDFTFPETYGGINFELYNDAIRKAAKKEKVYLMDLALKNYSYETLDGTHPTVVGHATMASAWISCLQEQGFGS